MASNFTVEPVITNISDRDFGFIIITSIFLFVLIILGICLIHANYNRRRMHKNLNRK